MTEVNAESVREALRAAHATALPAAQGGDARGIP